MSKYELREKARKLRKDGLPINEIKSKLNLSKSTISLWCRDITLTEAQYKKIKKEHIFKTQKGRLIGAQINKDKRLRALQDGEDFGYHSIGILNKKELVFLATALYWSEGSKSDSSTGFLFVNSDPEMILCMKRFLLECMEVKKEDLVCSVQINEIHKGRINKVLNFWKNLLQLPDEQIRKPYFVRTKVSKIYENHDIYYGICRLIVRRSSNLKYRMLGLIKALKTGIMPV